MYRLGFFLVIASLMIAPWVGAIGEEDPPDTERAIPLATISRDEGGVVAVSGNVSYQNPRFTARLSQPVIILEDQAGFVDRDQYFIIPVESQTLAQITSDVYQSPFTYQLNLPQEPKGTLRDVDQDGRADTGVMIFAVSFWNNVFGDPYLEERDLFGGGWSTAYVSTRISEEFDKRYEVIGGKYIVYAPDDQQGFPSGFGADGLLFTADDPIVRLPQGYTVVDMDSEPFIFDRSRYQTVDLYEPPSAVADDFSGLGYVAAFEAMLDKLAREYAFTEYRNIDWEALAQTYRPRFQAAERNRDVDAYSLALRDFLWEIPDGHIGMSFAPLRSFFQQSVAGGLGIALVELDDGRIIVNYLGENTPAARAGLQLGAEILGINGLRIRDYLESVFVWEHDALGTAHGTRLQQLRYATRFPINAQVRLEYRNPGQSQSQNVTLRAEFEIGSYNFSSIRAGRTFVELPVEFTVLDEGYGYVSIYSFSENRLLTIQLWERMIQTLNANDIPALIIDMRQNNGGLGFMADQMSAYFFDVPHELGNTAIYDKSLGDFYFDPRGVERLYLPDEALRYRGTIVVLIGPACFSACEFFAYNMTIENRAEIVGQYPTGGAGGSVYLFYMPEGITVNYTNGRSVDMNGEIHIEGKGIAPTIRVPVTEATVFSDGDPVLQAALDYLAGALAD